VKRRLEGLLALRKV